MRTTIDRIGKYELKAPLARTPTSTVYEAWDSVIARRVALKLMPLSTVDDFDEHEAFARFKRGAQAAGQLNHPNIVAVYDYGETDSYAYLVMELVGGSTLKDIFDGNQRFALPEIRRIVGSVLEALQYSHDRGVVHRDVKPANIMLTAEKQVKITDFGIARLEDSQITQAGMVIGTPAYMSPEQFLGEDVDWRTDIYSTGVVLYQMLTGERPYEGNLATIMHKVLYGSPLLPSRVSTLVTPALDAIVTKAMARNREDRFQTAAAFVAALQATSIPAPAQGRQGIRAQPPDTPGQARRDNAKAPGSSVRVLAFGTLIAAALAAGGWFTYEKFSSPGNNQTNTRQISDPERLQQREPARVREEQARQQQEQARLQQAQEAARQQQQAQRQQDEAVQAQLRQEQEARRRQQEALLKQEEDASQRDLLARRQQEQAQVRPQQQQEDPARLRQQQEVVRQKREQTRQEQEQARSKLAQDQARQKPAQEPGRAKPEPAETSPKPANSDASGGAAPRPSYPVTSSSGAIGLVCVSVTADTAVRYGLQSSQGVIVTGVAAGGAADRAGIRLNDLILKVKGSEIGDLSMLSKIVSETPPGQTVPVELVRQGNHSVVQLSVEPLRR